MAPKPKTKRPLDMAWEHCVKVVPNDDHQVKSKYYPTTMYGAINKLKQHLARVVCKNVTICDGCPVKVTIEMQTSFQVIKGQITKRARTKFEVGGMGRSQMAPPVSFSSPFFLPRIALGSQPTLNSYNEKKRKEENMAVMRF
jgi:hypothetical protein